MAVEHRKMVSYIELVALKSVSQKLVQKEKWAQDMLKLCCALEIAENQIENQEKEINRLQRLIRYKK